MAVAAPGLQKLSQMSFEAGAFPSDGVETSASTGMDRIPANGCADIVNGLIDEDGSIFRRGGSTYLGTKAASDTQPWVNLWSGYLGTVGQASLASRIEDTPVSHHKFYSMFPGDTDWAFRWSDLTSLPAQRPVAYAGMVIFAGIPSPSSGPGVYVAAWGGSTVADVTGDVLGQAVTFTEGSKTVTGAGTSFLSATPGMILSTTPPAALGDQVRVIESIESNTSLTLLHAWNRPTISTTMDISSVVSHTVAKAPLPSSLTGPVFVSTVADRLLYARGNRVAMTEALDPLGVFPDFYHELPVGAAIVGMEPLRDQLLVFSTHGVFVLSNLAYEMTDAQGNPQQRLERVAPGVVLWDNRGVAAYRGSVVAPCTDDIYLIDSASSMRPITGGMRRLYRSYVNAGYETGVAQVIDNHYLLPIHTVVPNTVPPVWVDTLVCDLRTGAWTRWADHGGTVRGFALKVGDQARQPQLLALSLSGTAPRVLDLTGAFTPSAAVKNDADGTTHNLRVWTRTYDLGDLVKRQWRRLRVRYELRDAASDNPYLEAYSEVDRLSPVQTDLVDDASEGEQVYTWRVSRRSRGIRFRLTQWGATSGARIRGLEVFFRPTGRR